MFCQSGPRSYVGASLFHEADWSREVPWCALVQTTLLGLAITLILALLAALVGPFFIDWTQYRPAFEVQASRLLGLPVRVRGPIDVRLLPSPSLLLNRIEIGSDATQQPLRARGLGIELALGSLIRGQVRATELKLVGPDVAVSIGKDGRLATPSLAVGVNLNDVSVARLGVEDARLALTDVASGRRTIVDKLWFNGEVRSLGAGALRGEGAFVLDGRLFGYRISSSRSDGSDTRIKLSLEPSDLAVLVENEGLLSFPEGVPRFEGSLTLTRPVGVALASGQTAMAEPWRITSRVIATPASVLFEHLEFQYGPEERAIKATGTAEMTFGEQPHVEAVISARQIDADRAMAAQDQPRRNPVSAVKALAAATSALSRWPMPVKIGFGVDGVTLGGSNLQSLRGDIALDAGGATFTGVEFRAPGFTQIQVSGKVSAGRTSFSGPVDVSSVDPRAFVAWLEGKPEAPAGVASPLRGRGDIVIDDHGIAVERLALEIDRKPVNGRLAYMHAAGGRNARLEAELRAADADIDAMTALAGAIFKDTKLELPRDVALALDLERARFAGLDAQSIYVKAAFSERGLNIERLSIGDFGGMKVDAKGVIDTASASPQGSVRVNLDARDLSGLSVLTAKFAPQAVDLVRGFSEQAGATSLSAMLNVKAGPDGRQSEATFDLSGSLGPVRVNLTGAATGTIAEAAAADVRLEGVMESDNTAALLRMLALDRVVASDAGSGKLTLLASGPLGGDMQFESRITSGVLNARAHGRLKPFSDQRLSGDFDLTISEGDAGALLQLAKSVPLTLSTRAILSGPSLTLEQASARIAGVPLRGRLALTFGQTVDIDGRVEVDAFDAAALFAVAAGLPASDELLSGEPFTRGLYRQAKGRVIFAASKANLTDALWLRDVKGVLRLAASELGFEIEDAEISGGRLSAAVSMRQVSDVTTAKARIALKNADGGILRSFAPAGHLDGKVNLAAELDGSGRSPKALIGSLSGAGTLTLIDARVPGLDPNAFTVAMRAVDQGLPLDGERIRGVVQPALDAGVLSLHVAEAPFTVSGGQLRFGTLMAEAASADVTMSGVLDLAGGTLDSRLALTDAKVTTSAGRPQISMQIKGPVGAPARTVDVAALTGWLALRAVEQQSKKLEAIERGGAPVTSSVAPPSIVSPPVVMPERPPVLPRTRPSAEIRMPSAPMAAPLPPPIDIRPAPGFAPAPSEHRPHSRPVPRNPAAIPRDSTF